jgi:hypothetical protein
MSPRTSPQSIDTAVGRLDATALEEVLGNLSTNWNLNSWRSRRARGVR